MLLGQRWSCQQSTRAQSLATDRYESTRAQSLATDQYESTRAQSLATDQYTMCTRYQ